MKQNLTLLLLFVSTFLFSQETYVQTSNNNFSQSADHMILTKDGGTVISAPEATTSQIFFEKFKVNGKLAWSKNYGINNRTVVLHSMIPAPNNGFLACFKSSDSVNQEIIIFKTDSLGNTIWQKKVNTLTTVPNEYIFGMLAESKDGGFYYLQRNSTFHYSYIPGHYSLYKFDGNGTAIWNNQFIIEHESDYGTVVSDITETSEGGVVLALVTVSCESYCKYVAFLKFNHSGQPEWKYNSYQSIYSYSTPVQLLTAGENGNIIFVLEGDFHNKRAYYIYTVLNTKTGIARTYSILRNIFNLQNFLRKKSIDQVKGKSFKKFPGSNTQGYSPTNIYGFDNDWNLMNASYIEHNNEVENILIEKYDKFGRICPRFNLPAIDDSVTIGELIYSKSYFHLKNKEEIVIEETSELTVITNDVAVTELCKGKASQTTELINVPDIQDAKSSMPEFKIAPNPVTNNFKIYITAIKAEQIQLQITDLNGSSIQKQSLLLQKGTNTINETLPALASGFYFIKITSNYWTKNLKIFKK